MRCVSRSRQRGSHPITRVRRMAADMGTRNLKFGATYPTLDLGTDPAVLRDWAAGMESIDFDEIFIPEHVVGINAGLRPDWEPLNPNTLKKDKPIYDRSEERRVGKEC